MRNILDKRSNEKITHTHFVFDNFFQTVMSCTRCRKNPNCTV